MDVVIASLHLPCMKPGSRAENTEAYLNVMKNPYVNIIGHPDTDAMKLIILHLFREPENTARFWS